MANFKKMFLGAVIVIGSVLQWGGLTALVPEEIITIPGGIIYFIMGMLEK